MRVLIDALQAGNRSGTGRVVEQLARHLPPLLAEEEELLWLWPRQAPRPIPTPGSRVLGFPALPPAARAVAAQALWPLLRLSYRPGLTHYASSTAPWPAGSSPSIATVYDACALEHPEWFQASRAAYYAGALRRALRTARSVLAPSETVRTDLARLGLCPPERIEVVPLGPHPDAHPRPAEASEAFRRAKGLPERYALYVGTLEPRKNLVRLIRAFECVCKDSEVHLVIAGRQGWKCAPILRAAETSPLAARIRFLDFVPEDELMPLIAAADVFACPSLYEGFGLPVLDALACGVPVVASSGGALPEVVGDAGLTPRPNEVDQVAAALADALTDEDLRQRLRTAGPKRAAQFTWGETAQRTLECYRRVARQTGRP